jgi:hypothetical protein
MTNACDLVVNLVVGTGITSQRSDMMLKRRQLAEDFYLDLTP